MDRSVVTCLQCRKPRTGELPIHCSCGNIIGTRTTTTSTRPPRKLTHAEICRTNECGHYKDKRCLYYIEQQKAKGENKGGWVSHLATRPWIRCPLPEPMWFVGDVGFLSTSYMQIGGTETFHRTLVPRLSNVAGFVSLNKGLSNGDFSLLGCQYGIGLEAAKKLARDCKVLVVWGIGLDLGDILKDLPQRPKVVSVSHCDARSNWTIDYMLKQEEWTDKFVYINKHGLGTVPLIRREDSILIPNGIDEKRTITTRTREEVRTSYGIPENARLGVMITRYSEEKGIRESMIAAHRAGHYLLVAGNASYWNMPYLKELENLVTDKVRLVPAVENSADLLIAADYYLSLSKYEGFGLSIAEAMAVGVQVISTPVGLVDDRPETAHVLEYRPYTNDVIKAICNPTDTRAVAKEVILNEYNSQVFTSRWQELLNDLAGVSVPTRQRMQHSLPTCRP